jgi:ribonuclease VapC
VIVDTSAIVAVVTREPGYEALVDRMAAELEPGIGAPTLVETAIVVMAKLGLAGRSILARLLQETALVVIPFQEEHLSTATEAYVRFGKGRHPAQLNFGDCMTYATARLADEPLLCVGDDFAKTDLALAI